MSDILYHYYDLQDIYVSLRAQAMICCKIVTVQLGRKSIHCMSYGSLEGKMELIDID